MNVYRSEISTVFSWIEAAASIFFKENNCGFYLRAVVVVIPFAASVYPFEKNKYGFYSRAASIYFSKRIFAASIQENTVFGNFMQVRLVV